jgi:oligoribonuclease NrnB/cAMP/cGMP phosphodiesterase (DHH superfamily)
VKRVCFYHAGCPDGFGAAWAVRQAWGDDGRFVARGHDDVASSDEYADWQITFVDIAPENNELRRLAEVGEQVTVLDHHVSARDRFDSEPELSDWLESMGHLAHFELGHSGAVLAWQHFRDGEPVPDLLRYVEDQDLWSWQLPRSREVNAAIGSYPLRFEVWDELARRPWEELAREGEALVRSQRVQVERLLAQASPLRIDQHLVEGVNATEHRSSVGHELADRARYDKPWGCVYRIEGGRVHATLYSIGDLDVAKIAVDYGGGGHRNAAGFSMTLDDWTAKVA